MAFEDKDRDLTPEEDLTERSADGVTSGDVTLAAADNEELLDEVLDSEEELPEDPEELLTGKEKPKKKKPSFTWKPKRDARRLRTGALASVLTVVVVAAIFLFNVIVGLVENRWPLVIDTTEVGIYTLSEEATEIAKGIEQEVQIVVCADESLLSAPNTGMEAFDNMFLQLHAALDSFRALSGGKVTVTYLDLNADPLEATKYTELGATSNSVVYICGDNSRVTSLMEDYTDYSYEEIYYYINYYGSSVTVNSLVENTLVTNINSVCGNDLPGITLLSGHKADETVISTLSDLFGKRGYTVETVDITTTTAFAEDSSLVVIPAPTEDYSETEIKRLLDWVTNENNYNHHVMLITAYAVDTPNLDAFAEDTLGVTAAEEMVWQTDTNYIYSGAQSQLYSYADSAATDFTAAGTRVLAPISRVLYEADAADQTISPLYTFPDSTQLFNMEAYEADQENYQPVDADEYPLMGAALSQRTHATDKETYGLVFGSSQFFYAMSAFSQNEDLVRAAVDGVLGNEDAYTLESKALTTSEVFNVGTQAAASVLFVLFVLVIPAATLVICLVVFLKRRHL